MKEMMNETMELTMDELEQVNGGCKLDEEEKKKLIEELMKKYRISDEDWEELMERNRRLMNILPRFTNTDPFAIIG